MHTPLAFQIMNHRVDGGRIERIAADQERMKREAAPQEVVLNILRDIAIHAFVGLHPDEIRRDFEHIRHMQKWLIGQFHKSLLEDRFGCGDKLLVASLILGIPAFNLVENKCLVTVVIKATSVVIEDAVKGVARDELHIIFASPARQSPEVIKEKRRGDDGRAAVEDKAVDLIHIGASAQFVALLKQVYAMASGGEADGGAQTTKAATNHDNLCHLMLLLIFLGKATRWRIRRRGQVSHQEAQALKCATRCRAGG